MERIMREAAQEQANLQYEAQCDALRIDLEKAIQKLLMEFEEEAHCEIDEVRVDTREFGNLRTEVFTSRDKP
jgi:hypothetical protein